MVYSYNSTKQTLATNADVIYNNDVVKTGTTVTHTPGTSIFTLNRPGYYYVTVTASGAATAAGTDPISLALFNGTVQLPGAVSTALSEDTTSMTINTIIPVRPSCCMVDNTVELHVVNTGVEATYDNTTITITKIA